MTDDWLQQLKPGDKVIVSCGIGHDRISTVDRVTATQVIVGGTKYNRLTGRKCGPVSAWNCWYLHEAEPARVLKIEHDNLVSSVVAARREEWEHMPIERLRQIKAWLQEAKSAKESNRD